MTRRKPAIATRVSPVVNASVRRLTKALGITISEYLRKLILQDLDSRKMFEDELKRAVEQVDEEEHTVRKQQSPEDAIRKFWRTPTREQENEQTL